MIYLTKNEKIILGELLNNASTPNTVLASRLGISDQAVGLFRRKLENEIIREYSLEINPEMFGLDISALVRIKLKEAFWKDFQKWRLPVFSDNLIALYQMNQGETDAIAHYGFRNMPELENCMQQIKDSAYGHIGIKQIYVFSSRGILYDSCKRVSENALEANQDQVRIYGKSNYFQKKAASRLKTLGENEKQVLLVLLENPDVPDSCIAEKIGLSSRGVGKIREALAQKEILLNYVAELNLEKIGVTTFLALFLSPRSPEAENMLTRMISSNPYLISCFRVLSSQATHFFLFGFRSLDQCIRLREMLALEGFEILSSYIFDHSGFVRHSYRFVSRKLVAEFGSK